MRSVLAIARLAFFEGIRMRIVVVFLLVLGFLVLRLPFAIRGDETLSGRLQNFLDYALAAVSILLSLTTILLSASTLAGEFHTRALHLVVTKQVSRLQILLGKWLGVNLLNLGMVALCGLAIYGFARFIANQPAAIGTADHLNVRDVVWTARLVARPQPPDLLGQAREEVRSRIEQGAILSAGEATEVAARVQQLDQEWRTVGPQQYRVYYFENLPTPRGAAELDAAVTPEEQMQAVLRQGFLQVKFKARAEPLPVDEMVQIGWQFVDPENNAPLGTPHVTRTRSGNIHQFLVSAAVVRENRAALMAYNPSDGDGAMLFRFEDDYPLQLLYRVSSFEENFAKVLGLTLLRLGFLRALGVFFGTFVAFPGACFCGLTWYVVSLGRPFWLEAIGANLVLRTDEIDPYGRWGPLVRPVLVNLMRVLFPDFTAYSGASQLVEGLYVPYDLLGRALLHTLGLGVVLLFGVGTLIFRQREIAEVTV